MTAVKQLEKALDKLDLGITRAIIVRKQLCDVIKSMAEGDSGGR
jgi:hypothetical protein